jgi:hypothetical protein
MENMESRLTQFGPSLTDIEGLNFFGPDRLPLWFHERMLSEHATPLPIDASDAQLLDARLAPWGEGRWFYGWGKAVLNGYEVLILDSDLLLRPVAFANAWGLGVHFVQPCSAGRKRRRVCVPRRSVARAGRDISPIASDGKRFWTSNLQSLLAVARYVL